MKKKVKRSSKKVLKKSVKKKSLVDKNAHELVKEHGEVMGLAAVLLGLLFVSPVRAGVEEILERSVRTVFGIITAILTPISNIANDPGEGLILLRLILGVLFYFLIDYGLKKAKVDERMSKVTAVVLALLSAAFLNEELILVFKDVLGSGIGALIILAVIVIASRYIMSLSSDNAGEYLLKALSWFALLATIGIFSESLTSISGGGQLNELVELIIGFSTLFALIMIIYSIGKAISLYSSGKGGGIGLAPRNLAMVYKRLATKKAQFKMNTTAPYDGIRFVSWLDNSNNIGNSLRRFVDNYAGSDPKYSGFLAGSRYRRFIIDHYNKI